MEAWANSFVGKLMRPAREVVEREPSPVTSFETGRRGKGVWFTLENGARVYRRYRGGVA